MLSKNLSKADKAHLARVKSLPCSVCDAPGPSAAHHIKQGRHFTCVALCYDCHQGSVMGWHGQKKAWLIRKKDEIDALDVTIKRLSELG